MGKSWLIAGSILLGILISIPCFSEEGKAPVCYLAFDEGEGVIVKDASGNAHDGNIMREGKYTKWVEGKVGKALEFTGNAEKTNEDGCVEITKMNRYDFSKGLTVEGWIKLNDKRVRSSCYEITSDTIGDR